MEAVTSQTRHVMHLAGQAFTPTRFYSIKYSSYFELHFRLYVHTAPPLTLRRVLIMDLQVWDELGKCCLLGSQ